MPVTSSGRDLGIIQAYYFLWIGAGGFLAQFVTLFYQKVGLNGTEVRGKPRSNAPVEKSPRVPLVKMVWLPSHKQNMIVFGLAFITLWLTTLGRSQFETLYLAHLGASAGVIGFVNTIGAFFEVPFMLMADRLVRRYGSKNILRISMIVQAASFLPVVFFPSIASISFYAY